VANVKDINIEAEVPWNWADELDANQLPLFARSGLNPAWGLRVHFRELGYVDNDHGGKTSMYSMTIEGMEAVRSSYVEAMIEAIESIEGAKVLRATEYDIENHDGWTHRG
jgi:hypothetical protein